MKTITIDCARCVARQHSCDDCVVGFLLGAGELPTLNADEQTALSVLARSRLVPPLRLVTADSPAETQLRKVA